MRYNKNMYHYPKTKKDTKIKKYDTDKILLHKESLKEYCKTNNKIFIEQNKEQVRIIDELKQEIKDLKEEIEMLKAINQEC